MRPPQSVLGPAGEQAAWIADLAWLLFAGGAAIFVVVIVFVIIAVGGRGAVRNWLASSRGIIAGGIAFPVVVLTALLVYSMGLTGAGVARPDPVSGEPLNVTVQGEQWWWRVTYEVGGKKIETANEIAIPVGRPVKVKLQSPDVIHSFWVPNLSGKTDMIPGQTNALWIMASAAGTYRGQCAEYCGGAHALMSFRVKAMEAAAFDAWLAREAEDAAEPATDAAKRGAELFASAGCGACHAIRGTGADGRIGPDLTHVGRRDRIGAEVLPQDAAGLAHWITENQHVKPANKMPAFRIFAPDDLDALAAYLAGLS